ncbi:MAG: DUF4369 domain-containing protein [Sphingobacteriales bacterium]
MKRTLFPLFLLVICTCAMCTKVRPTSNIFTLKGRFTGKHADTIFLIYKDTNGKKLEQQVYINNGTFLFKGSISSPVYADLESNIEINPNSRSDVSNVAEIFLTPGDMTVTVRENDFDHAKITGSPLQDEWNNLQKAEESINQTRETLYGKMFAIERAGNTPENHKAHSSVSDQLDKYLLERDKIDYNYISAHPQSYLSAFLLENFANGEMRLDSIEGFYNPFSDTIKKSVSGMEIERIIKNRKVASVGNIVKMPMGLNADDTRFDPQSLKIDNNLILYFWAGWANDNLQLKPILNKYHTHGLQILAISLEDLKDRWLDSIKSDNISNWHNIHVGLVANLDTFYNINGMPPSLLLLVDKNRKIIGRYRGRSPFYKKDYGEGDISDLNKKLAELFSDQKKH